MLRRKPAFMKGYIEHAYHAYGIGRLAWGESFAEEAAEEDKLARHGAKLSIVIDRFEYAGYAFGQAEAAHRMIHAAVARALDKGNRGKASCEPRWEQLRELYQESLRHAELDASDSLEHEELYASAERYFMRFIRMRALLMELGCGMEDYLAGAGQLVEAYQETAARLEYLAVRHFYKAVKARQFQTMAAICAGSEFFRTTAALLQLYLTAEERIETREARLSWLSREYHAGAICMLGSEFDFDVFGEEETSPLMPEVVDYLYEDAR